MDETTSDSQEPPNDDAMLDAPTGILAGGSASVDSASSVGHQADTSADDLDAPTMHPDSASGNGALLSAGQQIDEYELIREIARGGMGVVYLAKQTNLNRFVALKMVLESDSATDDEIKRFENEARAAGALDHPGIVPVYEVGNFRGHPYFSMAYVDGKSLAAMLGEGPLEPMRAAEIAHAVATALSHAHDQGIIHRDIKPANILIDSEGTPKITDFGVCKTLASQSQLTTHGELIGTPHYMPPEQAGGTGIEVAPQSDVYSIGAVLYAMLTTRPPFQAPSPIDVIAQVMTKDPVPPSRFLAGVPSDLETITLKCLSKSQKDRYASARLLADDLERFTKGEPILARPPGLVKRINHFIRRHVFLASVSGSFALLLVLLAILMSLALIQSQRKVAQLSELLQIERQGAKKIVFTDNSEQTTEQSYDVQRLTSAATRFAEDDPQLAIHLAVYAGRLAQEHDVIPPAELTDLLKSICQSNEDEFDVLISKAQDKIDRELTDFELAVYGLFDPAHKMGMGPDSTINKHQGDDLGKVPADFPTTDRSGQNDRPSSP